MKPDDDFLFFILPHALSRESAVGVDDEMLLRGVKVSGVGG